jgi:hypothetical protein
MTSARVLAMIAFVAGYGFAAEPVAWGPPVDGVRLGITLDLESAPRSVVLVLENNGSTTRYVYVGMDKLEFVEFTAVAPNGAESPLRLVKTLSFIAGSFAPIIFKLLPGGQEKIVLNLDKILDANATSFETLAQRGYGLRASMKVAANALQILDMTLWGAELVSGVTPRVR